MKTLHRSLFFFLMASASLLLFPAVCPAQLVPTGDFRGKSLSQWGFDYTVWAISSVMGGQTLPDVVDGVKYLPPYVGGFEFVGGDVTIQQGTPVLLLPFFLNGERYDNGTEDNPADPIIEEIYKTTTIRLTFDGTVVLEGVTSEILDRKFGTRTYPSPITYTNPQPRGEGINSIAGTFSAGGITTIFDNLSLGQHTLVNEFDSKLFGLKESITYNINVVPEPSSLCGLVTSLIGLAMLRRRRKKCAELPQ
jgi:hypothetical protein